MTGLLVEVLLPNRLAGAFKVVRTAAVPCKSVTGVFSPDYSCVSWLNDLRIKFDRTTREKSPTAPQYP